MKRLLIVCMLAGTAQASPVKAPAGWVADPKAAMSLSQQLGGVPHFGGLKGVVTTEAYNAPAGGSLFVTRVVASTVVDNKTAGPVALDEKARNAAATAELDELRAAAARAGATIDNGGTKAIADARLLEATARWHDSAVTTIARTVVAADGQQIVAVSGECVLANDAATSAPAKELAGICEGALASLDPELAPDKRVGLELSTSAAPSGSKPSTMQPPSEGSSGPALTGDGPRPAMPPMAIPQPTKETDRRPIYVGLGLIVLAAIFWWNRKQREKLESDYEERTGGKSRSADADDLHAAADEPADGDDKPEPKGDTKEGKS